MKLMVDVSEKDWKFMQKTYKETGLSFVPSEIKNECVKAVYNGTPYEERKVGKWIDTGSGQECSCCSEVQYGYDNGRRYCPNWHKGNHPPKAGEYLVTVRRGFVEILYYIPTNVWKRYSYKDGYYTEDFDETVVAWAELPEHYKEVEE